MLKAFSLNAAIATLALASGATVLSATRQEQALGVPAAAPHGAVAFIVNAANPHSEVAIGDLRRMLLGEMTRWSDGQRVTVAMREPGASERNLVLGLICRMDEAEFARYVLHAAYRGESQPGLKQLDTPTGVRRFVFNVPGAIGYVRADEIDPSVKVLKVVGGVSSRAVSGLTLWSR